MIFEMYLNKNSGPNTTNKIELNYKNFIKSIEN